VNPTFKPVFVSNADVAVAFAANTALARSIIFTYTVPAGNWVQLRNNALLVLDLRTAANVLISQDSRILIGYRNPGQIGETWIHEAGYMPWFRTALNSQTNDQLNGSLRIPVSMRGDNGAVAPYLNRGRGRQILIGLISPQVIAVANSRCEVETWVSPWSD